MVKPYRHSATLNLHSARTLASPIPSCWCHHQVHQGTVSPGKPVKAWSVKDFYHHWNEWCQSLWLDLHSICLPPRCIAGAQRAYSTCWTQSKLVRYGQRKDDVTCICIKASNIHKLYAHPWSWWAQDVTENKPVLLARILIGDMCINRCQLTEVNKGLCYYRYTRLRTHRRLNWSEQASWKRCSLWGI